MDGVGFLGKRVKIGRLVGRVTRVGLDGGWEVIVVELQEPLAERGATATIPRRRWPLVEVLPER